jgi:hypothetical protein
MDVASLALMVIVLVLGAATNRALRLAERLVRLVEREAKERRRGR